MPKKKPKGGKPQVHKDLEGLEVEINEFGEIKTNMSASSTKMSTIRSCAIAMT